MTAVTDGAHIIQHKDINVETRTRIPESLEGERRKKLCAKKFLFYIYGGVFGKTTFFCSEK